MTQHLQGHEPAGYDDQLAAWLEHHKHETLNRIHYVRHQVDELHAMHSEDSWWSAVKPAFQTIPQPAAEAVAHLAGIGRTDLPAYEVFEAIVAGAHGEEIERDRANGRPPSGHGERTLWEALTPLLDSWAAMLYAI